MHVNIFPEGDLGITLVNMIPPVSSLWAVKLSSMNLILDIAVTPSPLGTICA
jgi:hypothetical protein